MFNFSIEHFWKLKKGHQHLLLQSFRENIKENGTKSLVIYGIIYSTFQRELGSNPSFQMLERERIHYIHYLLKDNSLYEISFKGWVQAIKVLKGKTGIMFL